MRPWVEKAFAGLESLGLWFRRRYNLPPNDPRFLSLTYEELLVDYLTEQLEKRILLATEHEKKIVDLASLLGPITVEEREKAIVAEDEARRVGQAAVMQKSTKPPVQEEEITFGLVKREQ